jgi:hypothetical protein
MLPSPRGPSKRYINLIIWSRPRVSTVCAWVSTSFFLLLLPSLPSSLHHLLASLAILCNRKYPLGSSSCQFQWYLYFRTSQDSIVFYQLPSSIVGCTSGLPSLQLSSSIFSSSIVTVLPDYSGYNCLLRFFSSSTVVFFRSFYLVINI